MAHAAKKCVNPESLEKRAVLIEEDEYGRATATLYEDDIVITNHTITWENEEAEKKVEVYIPTLGKAYMADIIYSQRSPDISFLKLPIKVPNTKPLDMPISYKKNELLYFVSFTLGSREALAHSKAWYLNDAKFTGDSSSYYYKVNYADWALAGDNGGAYYTCDGRLAGINFGNFQLTGGDPTLVSNIYAINTRALERAMQKAGIQSRRY